MSIIARSTRVTSTVRLRTSPPLAIQLRHNSTHNSPPSEITSSSTSPHNKSSTPQSPRPVAKPRLLNPLHKQPQYHPPLPPDFGQNQLVPISDQTLETLQSTLAHFRAPVRYAFAYGSGIYPQKGYDQTQQNEKRGQGSEGEKGGGNKMINPSASNQVPNAIINDMMTSDSDLTIKSHISSSPSSTSKSSNDQPMLDFIFATTHPAHFHSINLSQNPDHYPIYMRWLGSSAVAWLQDTLGAGVWFNAFCEVQGRVSDFCSSSSWDTVSLSPLPL